MDTPLPHGYIKMKLERKSFSNRKLKYVRQISIFTFPSDGDIYVNGSPLRFFHFTKLGPIGRKMTERYAGNNTEVFELWRWYREQIDINVVESLPSGYWGYGKL